ncbi:MAG: AAA family ATPase, partial [Phycisphaerales bacterium]
MPSITQQDIGAIEQQVKAAHPPFAHLRQELQQVIVGQQELLEGLVIGLLCNGHVLIEGVPGLAKTTAVATLAAALRTSFHRIQFTPDLLPSDVTGVSVFHQGSSSFEFHPGPVFAHVVLADEINRASPRTQSALLDRAQAQAPPMRPLGVDPHAHAHFRQALHARGGDGSDGDASAAEVRVLANSHKGLRVDELEAIGNADDIRRMIAMARGVHVEHPVMEYVVRLVAATRTAPGVRLGASPRGSVGLLRAAQVGAAMDGRAYVAPADIQRLAVPVLAHRIVLADVEAGPEARAGVIESVVAGVPARA